jgi:hypothetical protein
MRDLEAEMAKALEGQFFWEHTATPEDQTTGESRQIMMAQRKFFEPKVKTPKDIQEEEAKRLREIVERKRNGVVQCRAVNPLSPDDLKEFAKDLALVVADVHGVDLQAIVGRARGNRSLFEKHHYPWAMIRYFPLVSLRCLATAIGKDRGTLYHSDEMFTARQHEYTDKIAAVDTIVGYIR